MSINDKLNPILTHKPYPLTAKLGYLKLTEFA